MVICPGFDNSPSQGSSLLYLGVVYPVICLIKKELKSRHVKIQCSRPFDSTYGFVWIEIAYGKIDALGGRKNQVLVITTKFREFK